MDQSRGDKRMRESWEERDRGRTREIKRDRKKEKATEVQAEKTGQ